MCTVMADPTVVKSIYNNNVGCNTIQEVEASCILGISEMALNEAISIFPNPVSELLEINISKGIGLEKIIVFSTLGQQLMHSVERTVDFSSLAQGVYFVEIQTDHGGMTKKVVKR